jgi:hypothetical protein
MGSRWPPTEAGKRSHDDATLLYASSLLNSAREEIDRADAKASILLAASGVAAGALLAGLVAGNWTPLELQMKIQWVWWLGVFQAAAGTFLLALAVYPREQINDSEIPWAVIFYGDVLAYRSTTQLVGALERSAKTRIERTADQLRRVSVIVDRKYRLVRRGLLMLFLSAVTIMTAIIINLFL